MKACEMYLQERSA